MKNYFILLSLASLPLVGFAKADLGKEALKLVPGGMIEIQEKDEVKVKTSQGTFIEVEFNRDGTLDEASGDLAQKDSFVPANNLLSLNDAVRAMEKEGKKVEGEWSLDKGFLKDWEYEFEGVENGKKVEYVLNAKTGKLLDTKRD